MRGTWRKLVLAAGLAALGLPAWLFAAVALARLRHVRFKLPAALRPPGDLARERGGLALRYLGVSGYEVGDGRTVLLLDPTLTRPTLADLFSGPLESDEALAARLCPRADFILVNHAHHDHVLDVPSIALRTGATVAGSRSTLNLARSRGVAPDRLIEARPGERLRLGSFTVDVRRSRHAPILGIRNPLSGTIPEDARQLWFWQYRQDLALAFRLESNGTSIFFYPASTFEAGDLGSPAAGTLILGVTGIPLTAARVAAAVREARPERILPTHYDNFFQPLSKGLALMPGLDLDAARRAAAEGAPGLPFIVLDLGETIHLPPDAERA